MSLWSRLRGIFGSSTVPPPDARRLNGSSEEVLAASLELLPSGERGWITAAEAKALFSRKEDEYAFGETDDDGNARFGHFAAEHHCDVSFAPVEKRVYLIRKPSR